MKTILIAAATALIIIMSTLSSCKKDDNSSITLTGRSALIVGEWKEIYDGSDDNNNGIWDNAEKRAVPDSISISLVLNSNGTGSSTQRIFGGTFRASTTWSLINNEQDIKLVATMAGTSPATYYYNIISLDSNECVLRDTTQTPVQYEIFSRR